MHFESDLLTIKWKLLFCGFVHLSKVLISKNTILYSFNFGCQNRRPRVRFGRHVKALICIVLGQDKVHTMAKLLSLLFKIPGPLGSSSAFMPKLWQCPEVLLQFKFSLLLRWTPASVCRYLHYQGWKLKDHGRPKELSSWTSKELLYFKGFNLSLFPSY